MSSSSHSAPTPIFLVQQGIAAWEETTSILDGRWATVSIFDADIATLVSLLWRVTEPRRSAFKHLLRLVVGELPEMATKTLRRRLMRELSLNPPGFAATQVKISSTRYCVSSELVEHSAVNSDYLTDYRRTALLGLADGLSASELCDLACDSVTQLGSKGIKRLMAFGDSVQAAVRLLDLETHAAIQIIGSPRLIDDSVALLASFRIRHLPDPERVSEEINRFAPRSSARF
jgi:hypothetical protein